MKIKFYANTLYNNSRPRWVVITHIADNAQALQTVKHDERFNVSTFYVFFSFLFIFPFCVLQRHLCKFMSFACFPLAAHCVAYFMFNK